MLLQCIGHLCMQSEGSSYKVTIFKNSEKPTGLHPLLSGIGNAVATDHELLSCIFGALSQNPLTDFNFCDLDCGKPLQAWSCTTLVAVYCVSPSCHTTLGDQRWSQPELDTLFAEDQWRRTTMPTTTASVLP